MAKSLFEELGGKYERHQQSYVRTATSPMFAAIVIHNVSFGNIRLCSIPISLSVCECSTITVLENIFEKQHQAKEAAEAVLAQIDTMKKAILARAFRGLSVCECSTTYIPERATSPVWIKNLFA